MKLTLKELQEFILWAKSEKVQAFKLDGIEVAFSPLAFIDEAPSQNIHIPVTPAQAAAKEDEDFEKLLFHSSNS